MLKVLITGKNGQLGSTFRELSSSVSKIDFVFKDSKELDITIFDHVNEVLRQEKPDVVINCAAYTAVDRAEEEPIQADLVNHLGVQNLAQYCKDSDIGLIHISTDYVFDGKKGTPYEVDDATNPINVYGKTKLAGELAMRKIDPKGCIIRTSWVYSKHGSNFVKTMLRLGKERSEIKVVDDQFGSPTYATDLASACLNLLKNFDNWPPETKVFHYSNEGMISWYNFASEIMKLAELNCAVKPVSSNEYLTLASRPKMTSLMVNNHIFLNQTKKWQNSLYIFLTEVYGLKQ
jgi:dTDP-4-dehydrorhamnose reductase